MSDNSITDEIIKLKLRYRDLSIKHWLNYEVFTWVWWIGLISLIIPLIIWWKYVDRKRILEITVFGLLVNVSATFLDVFGAEYALWEYMVRLLPHIPLLFPVDFILLPVIEMLVYQRYTRWKSFFIANIIVAAALSFIIEPLVVLIGQYRLINWRFIYSFPIYIVIASFSKFVAGIFLSAKKEVTQLSAVYNELNNTRFICQIHVLQVIQQPIY